MLQKPTAKIGGGTGQQTACEPKRRFGDGGKLPFVCARQRFGSAESCRSFAQDSGLGWRKVAACQPKTAAMGWAGKMQLWTALPNSNAVSIGQHHGQ